MVRPIGDYKLETILKEKCLLNLIQVLVRNYLGRTKKFHERVVAKIGDLFENRRSPPAFNLQYLRHDNLL
jgi:hypothetical protein